MATFFAGAHSALKDHFGGSKQWVIPEYQREFSWGPENIQQLIRDLLDGIRRLDREQDSSQRAEQGAKFLGCVIEWARKPVDHVDFVVEPGLNYIGQVHELIDGQQRTSAITLLMCELYIEIGALAADLDQKINEEKELAQFLERTVQRDWLQARFSRTGMAQANPRRRPTLIRQGTDRWIHAGNVEYLSPISSYVHLTIEAIQGKQTLPVGDVHKDIHKILELIRDEFDALKLQPLPILEKHYDPSELFEELHSGAGVDIHAYLETSPTNALLIEQITTITALAHYLLNYAAFTVITSPNQSIALDMFQSLNSTGVQLTAVQLLKPRISQSFTINEEQFSTDATFELFKRVNEWLNTGRNSTSKTLQFFLKFGLGVFGEEPPNNSLSVQRVWLLDRFNQYTDWGRQLDATRDFVKLMGYTVDYLELFYFKSRDKLFAPKPSVTAGGRKSYDEFKLVHRATSSSYQLTDGGIFAFMFLIDAQHDIAHTMLLAFFIRFQQSSASEAHSAVQQFEKAILMLAAFFLLWRGLFSSRYPDDVYRQVLARLHYTSPEATGKASQIGRALRSALIRNLTKVVKKPGMSRKLIARELAKRLRYASGTQTLIRMFLLLATHKKTPLIPNSAVGGKQGFVMASASGPDYLYPDIWLGAEYKSIEHVAPQSLLNNLPGGWDPSLCAASDLINSVGNLTLLSIPMNASVPEDPKSKKLWYEGSVNPGAPPGVTPQAMALMTKSPHLAHLVPTYLRMADWIDEVNSGGSCPSEWNAAFIRERAENLADVVLSDLINWLRAA